MEKKELTDSKRIDWIITIVPLAIIVGLCAIFMVSPTKSNEILGNVRFFFGDTFGSYYLIIGLGMFLLSVYVAFSKYGRIVLGRSDEKPKYNFFTWGAMMFTAGLAADILFYSFSEWFMYAAEPHLAEMQGGVMKWAGTYSLYHWSLIPWAFYLVLAVAFGFMLHVRNREKQKYSEACRPILGKRTDGILGTVIDLLAVFALIAGTATTFSVATPLMAEIINTQFGIDLGRSTVTIIILVLTCTVYTYALLHGFRGIGILAKTCVFGFFGLLFYVFLFGGQTKFIVENGLYSIGTMIQNFFEMSTYADPLRTNSFPQNWTIYFWAYWMVWCVAAPFFIGNISRGRTVKQVILGGYAFGVGSTCVSFVVLENYSMGLQFTNKADFIASYGASGDMYGTIIDIINTIPISPVVMLAVLLIMILFYSTSFDSIALTASSYSYKRLLPGQNPHKSIQLMWCILLILLPIGLVFSESSMSNLQTVSIVAAFPIGIVMVLIILSFLKDGKKYLQEKR